MTDAEVLAKTKELYGEDEQMRQETLRVLRAWIKQQPHFTCRTDETFLLGFARGCKYSMEKTKQKIDLFLTMRSALPEFFRGWDPLKPDMQAALACGGQLPLPGRDNLRRKVVVIRGGSAVPGAHKPEDLEKANMMVMEALSQEKDEDMFVMGFVVIIDMDGMTMSHLTSKPIPLVMKQMRFVQDALPFSPKAIFFVRTSSLFTTAWALMQPIFNEKMKSRVQVLGNDFEKLQKLITAENLPKDYGGEGPTLDELARVWKKKVELQRTYLKEQEKYGTDESRRPGKAKTSMELFGIEGSFRKLNID